MDCTHPVTILNMVHENKVPALVETCVECQQTVERHEKGSTAIMDVSGLGVYYHKVGDESCRQGWCDAGDNEFPKKCDCGGLIHAEFEDEDIWEDKVILMMRCERCNWTLMK